MNFLRINKETTPYLNPVNLGTLGLTASKNQVQFTLLLTHSLYS